MSQVDSQQPPAEYRPRPSNVDELRESFKERGPFMSPPDMKTRPSDIMIATYPKCGTTWMQQIVHGLRTGGSMDFEEISQVVAWVDISALMGIDPNGEQVAEPRAFKTHLSWDLVPKGCRYIYVVRDPADALVSFYHFVNGLMFERDSIDLDRFAGLVFFERSPSGLYWDHVRSWWEQRDQEDVLFATFEDMKQDLDRQVRRVAVFMGLEADEERIAIATRQSTFAFMRDHQSKFDDHPTTAAMSRAAGHAPATTSKVRGGRVGDGVSTLSGEVLARLAEEWKRRIEEPLGIRSYEGLRARIAERPALRR